MKIALLWLFEPAGRWFLTVLLLWAAVQFFCHELLTLFGASERSCAGITSASGTPSISFLPAPTASCPIFNPFCCTY